MHQASHLHPPAICWRRPGDQDVVCIIPNTIKQKKKVLLLPDMYSRVDGIEVDGIDTLTEHEDAAHQ